MVGKSTLGSAETAQAEAEHAECDDRRRDERRHHGPRMQSSESVIAQAPVLRPAVRPAIHPTAAIVRRQRHSLARQPFSDHGCTLESSVDIHRLDLGHAIPDHEHVAPTSGCAETAHRRHDRTRIPWRMMVGARSQNGTLRSFRGQGWRGQGPAGEVDRTFKVHP